MDDWQLLRDYVERGSEAHFETLVKRHVDMVHATALRQVRDPHLAQDVTQAVFILLARKAASLSASVILGGWLYRTTSHVASRALRDRVRQHRREEEAATMISNEPAEELWGKLAPHLDAAMGALGATDRDAVVLRYLQRRSFRDVAAALGVSEDAAKKRVVRALEKLRSHLTRRGIAVSGALLGTAIATGTAQAAPANVVATAISAGAAGTTTTASALNLAGQVAREWVMTKLKWSAGFAVLAVLSLLLVTNTKFSESHSPQIDPVVASPLARLTEETPLETVAELGEASPRNPRTMNLKVESSRDGAPMTGAVARIAFYGTGIVMHTAANADGVMEITRPDRRYEGMAFWVAAPGHVPKCLSWKREEEFSLPSEYLVQLDPGVRVAGRVVDETGQPVTGATLRFAGGGGMRWNARDYVDYRFPISVPTSDARGEWTADFLEAGSGAWGFVKHPDYAETEFKFPVGDTSAEEVTVIIRAGAPVSGVVLGPDTAPVPHAQVTAGWQHTWRDEIRTVSDANGRFHFAHVTPGQFRLTVSADGYKTLEQWCDLKEEGLNVTATLTPKRIVGNATLRGRVVDEAGNGIPAISVSISHGQPTLEGVDWTAKTDDEGRFAWTQAPEGVMRFNFTSGYAGHYENLSNVELASGETEHLISLKTAKMAEARLTVFDKSSGLAISRFKVMVGTRDTSFRYGRDDLSFAGEGANGHCAFPWRPDKAPDRIHSMPIVRIEADGYEPETVGITNITARGPEIEVGLELSYALEGVVLAPSGNPASGAQVALVGGNLSVTMQTPARFSLEGRHEHTAIARSDGSFRLASRKEGERLMIVHDAGWAVIHMGEFVGGVIFLQPWGRIEGILRVGRELAADKDVTVQTVSELGRTDTISCLFSAKTDSSGRFQFDKIPPGRARVGRKLLSPFSRDGTGYTANTQEKSVGVKAGETTRVTLGGAGVQVIGRVLLEPRREDTVLELNAQNLRPAAQKPDPTKPPTGYGFFCRSDGSFAVEDVPPGTYVLEIRIEAVKDRNDPESALRAFPVGRREIEVVIPEGQQEKLNLGEIVVPAGNNR